MTAYEPQVENALVEDMSDLENDELDLMHQVESAYQSCWNEFYEWEPKYCREELRKLGDGSVDLARENVWTDIEEWEETNAVGTGGLEVVQVLLGAQLNTSEVRVKTWKLRVDFPPVPPYEFCMPITRCIPCIEQEEEELDEDVSVSELADSRPRQRRVLWIKFCPFTDPDESFPTSERNRLLDGTKLEWETQPYVDNDVDIIEIETVARLRHLSFDKIDDLHILPRPIHPHGDEMGILGRWNSREPLMPPNWTPVKDLPSHVLQTETGELIRTWCPICIEFECIQHFRSEESSESLDTMVPTGPQPSIIEVDRKCGDECIFLHTDNDTFDPSEDTITLLQELLFDSKVLEWTESCEIASIIARPCWQVHKIMEAFLESQEEGFEAPNTARGEDNFGNLVPDFADYKPYSPCAHSGPCVDCSCAVAGSWCGIACRCSKKCTSNHSQTPIKSAHSYPGSRRARGCTCSGRCDDDSSCLCRKQGRECEPSQCVKCWSDDAGAKCKNNFLQRRKPRKTEVRRAKYGWGLFALEDIRSGDFIIDYTGGIYSTDTAEPRAIVANHVKRNYNFGLSSKTDVDAYAAGNESRVINDYITNGKSDLRKINCVVQKIWFAGDLHLVIVASKNIKIGEELYLSYGSEFWQTSGSQNPPTGPKEKKKKNRRSRSRMHRQPGDETTA